MTGDNDSHGEGDRQGHNRDRGTNGIRPPRDQQGPGHRPRVVRGGERTRDTAEEAGMRRGAQRRMAEAGGWGRSPGGKRITPREDVGSD